MVLFGVIHSLCNAKKTIVNLDNTNNKLCFTNNEFSTSSTSDNMCLYNICFVNLHLLFMYPYADVKFSSWKKAGVKTKIHWGRKREGITTDVVKVLLEAITSGVTFVSLKVFYSCSWTKCWCRKPIWWWCFTECDFSIFYILVVSCVFITYFAHRKQFSTSSSPI